MRSLTPWLACILALAALPSFAYDYPLQDRFAASIVGTPTALEAKLPVEIPSRTWRLAPIRPVPKVFWYEEGLEVSAALQDRRAPLVFLVAGTGAAHDSSKNVALAKALYAAGFHVVSLPSATHFDFIVNASSTGLAGYLPDDTADTYRVMEQVWNSIEGKAEVSEFLVAGYSLGGITAAFLARLDEERGRFGFRRAFMINPPVDLYTSVRLLDGYLDDNLSVGEGGKFLDALIQQIAVAYQPDQGMRLDEDFIYRAYGMTRGSGLAPGLGVRNPEAALIGMAFRLSSSAMVFAGDVIGQRGYITPAGKAFERSESLEYYAWASAQIPFARYVDDLLVPAVIARHPGSTRAQVLRESSMKGIEEWLRTSGKVWAVTNADEIILAPGDIDWLRGVLGPRLRVYPRGGHCGNLLFRDNVRDTLAVLGGRSFVAEGG